MKVTRAMLVMMLFLGGCGGCGSCEHAENPPPGAGAPAAAAAGGAIRPPDVTPGTIHAGSVEPTVVAQKPTARPPAQAAGQPRGAAQPQGAVQPEAAAPEGSDADEDDCIVVADANPDYGPPPLAVGFSAEAECSGGEPRYDWDFGDGSPHSSEANPSHTYAQAGEFTATVTVTGRGDVTANDEIDITVEEGEGGEAE
jgi:hypothetical protein